MKTIIGSLAVGLALAGCSSGGTTQYLVNWDQQMAITTGTNAKCSLADQTGVTVTNNLKNDMIISIYQGDDGKYYADFGSRTLSGTFASNVYTLSDSSTCDDNSGGMAAVSCTPLLSPGQNREIKSSDVVTVSLTVNGSFITGSWTEETHAECDDQNGSNACSGEVITDCISKTNLRGRSFGIDTAVTAVPQP